MLLCAYVEDLLLRVYKDLQTQVQDHDEGHCESQAAAYYFPQLFGEGFVRFAGSIQDKALNYGYIVLRSAVARSLVAYGFVPSLGLHHKSELNAFNLADDMIEAFRPLVDVMVFQKFCMAGNHEDLTAEERYYLASCLQQTVLIQGKRMNVTRALDLMMESLQNLVWARGRPSLLYLL